MIEGLLVVVVASVLVTEVVDALKPLLPENEKAYFMTSLALGLAVAFTFGIDIFALLGFTAAVPFVGIALSGPIIARGAAAVYDLLDRLQNPIK